MKKIFSVESNGVTPPCPHCGGELKYRDSRPRIHCREGGTKEWFIIRRLKCRECGELHSELPDCLVPYKHYDSEIIAGVIDGIVTPDDADSEDYPCEETMKRWLQWYREDIFTDKAVDEIYKVSTGIPRRINHICDGCLMYASQQNKRLIDEHQVQFVIEHEMLGSEVS